MLFHFCGHMWSSVSNVLWLLALHDTLLEITHPVFSRTPIKQSQLLLTKKKEVVSQNLIIQFNPFFLNESFLPDIHFQIWKPLDEGWCFKWASAAPPGGCWCFICTLSPKSKRGFEMRKRWREKVTSRGMREKERKKLGSELKWQKKERGRCRCMNEREMERGRERLNWRVS